MESEDGGAEEGASTQQVLQGEEQQQLEQPPQQPAVTSEVADSSGDVSLGVSVEAASGGGGGVDGFQDGVSGGGPTPGAPPEVPGAPPVVLEVPYDDSDGDVDARSVNDAAADGGGGGGVGSCGDADDLGGGGDVVVASDSLTAAVVAESSDAAATVDAAASSSATTTATTCETMQSQEEEEEGSNSDRPSASGSTPRGGESGEKEEGNYNNAGIEARQEPEVANGQVNVVPSGGQNSDDVEIVPSLTVALAAVGRDAEGASVGVPADGSDQDTGDEKTGSSGHSEQSTNEVGVAPTPQAVTATSVDLDDFFGTAGVTSSPRSQGQFPALDNVDFESDEEGAGGHDDGERDGGRGGGDMGDGEKETKTGEEEEDGNGLEKDGDYDSGQQQQPVEDVKPNGKKSKRKKDKQEKFYELQPDITIESVEESASMSETDSVIVSANVNNNNNNNNNGDAREGANLNSSNDDGKVEVGDDDDDDDAECVVKDEVSPASVEEGDRNNSAGSRLESGRPSTIEEDGEDSYASTLLTSAGYHRSPGGSYRYDHDRGSSPRSRRHDLSHSPGGRAYYSSRGSSFLDSQHYRSGDSSSFYRSGELSSVDSSRLSTRSTRIERGDPRTSQGRSESSMVPKFNTLHDQQVSWLEMFKMIEQQHRTELQSQYKEHQQILRDMQRNMEQELSKQQDTLKQRLSTHREILEELSPGRRSQKHHSSPRDRNQSRHYDIRESASQRSADGQVSATSQTSLQGVPVSLRNPPPLSGYHQDYSSRKPSDQLPLKRSLEHEMSSPSRPADTSLNPSKTSVGKDKQLKGGVYSSPMPLAKVKHKNSPRSSKSCEETSRKSPRGGEGSRNTNATDHSVTSQSQVDSSLAESEDVLSPRSRISLREKHAKHLSDLRAYYEEELREMRQLLSSKQDREVGTATDSGNGGSSGGDGATTAAAAMNAGERILVNENHELRQRCQQLEDDCQDAKIQIRELQQKMQGLEIRASDYAERYDTTQSQVLSLRSRLEELTEFAKEKESRAGDLDSKNKRLGDSLQMAYKKEKELTESLHSAKTTIQRLVDKYETLEKDHQLLKENMSTTEGKLFSSRSEALESNNKLSRLELETKQLQHDNEILKHELALARSSTITRTSYEDAYQPRGSPSSKNSRSPRQTSRPVPERTFRSLSRERQETSTDQSPESETDSEFTRSPIIRAERELKKLQHSLDGGEFEPKLQRKFYGTELSSGSHRAEFPSSPNRSNKSGYSAQGLNNVTAKDSNKSKGILRRDGATTSTTASAPLSTVRGPGRGESAKVKEGRLSGTRSPRSKDLSNASRKPVFENGLSGERAVEMTKSGEVLARPAWEDVYTSMARPSNTGNKSSNLNSTRDQMLRERLQNIENLERKYDDLQNDKRKFESALSKLPSQGHRREKDRLETELDRLDRELGSVRMSLKRFHVLKSTI